jgi:hypothetical protein
MSGTLRRLSRDARTETRLRGTRKCRVRSLLANFDSAGRHLSRHLKYIAPAWLIHAFLSSNPPTLYVRPDDIGHRVEQDFNSASRAMRETKAETKRIQVHGFTRRQATRRNFPADLPRRRVVHRAKLSPTTAIFSPSGVPWAFGRTSSYFLPLESALMRCLRIEEGLKTITRRGVMGTSLPVLGLKIACSMLH